VSLDEGRVRELLARRGVRRTAQRVAVLLILAAAHEAVEPADRVAGHAPGSHLTSRQIHNRLVEAGSVVDLTTVYRTVPRLEAVGVVHSTVTPHAVSYELASSPHHHAVCTRCGRVTEIDAGGLQQSLRPILSRAGLVSAASLLTIHGVCTECAAAASD
jgi:Fur family transcriptional regulator, ferric uptake regulator